MKKGYCWNPKNVAAKTEPNIFIHVLFTSLLYSIELILTFLLLRQCEKVAVLSEGTFSFLFF